MTIAMTQSAVRFLLLALLVTTATTCSAATSCIQNKESGTYEAATKGSDKPCPTTVTVAFFLGEQPTNSAPEQLRPQEITQDVTTTYAENMPAESVWHLKAEDGSVYAALKRWATTAGWQMSWEIPVDFPIEILDSSTGSFEASVRRVLTAFRVSDYPPYPCFHENRVVRVVRRVQGNDDECKQ